MQRTGVRAEVDRIAREESEILYFGKQSPSMTRSSVHTSSSHHIRRASSDDAGAVAACVQAAYQPWIATIGTKPGPMKQDYSQVISEAQVFLAESEAGVDGILVLRVDSEEFLLENVAVHPRAKGKGLGACLLAIAEREAMSQGFNSLSLYTHERMATNIALYLMHGYVEFDRRTEHGLPRVFMRKLLPAQ